MTTSITGAGSQLWAKSTDLNSSDALKNSDEQSLSGYDARVSATDTVSRTRGETMVWRALITKPFKTVVDEKVNLVNLVKSGQLEQFNQEVAAIETRKAFVKFDVSSRMDTLNVVIQEAQQEPVSDQATLSQPATAQKLGNVSTTQALSASEESNGSSSAENSVLLSAATEVSSFSQSVALYSAGTDTESATTFAAIIDSPVIATLSETATYSTSSSREICQAVADAIGEMEEGYLSVFQEAVETYASFYSDFADLFAKFQDYVGADDDSTTFDGSQFRADIAEFMAKYTGDGGRLHPSSGSLSEEEAIAWAKEFGLDPDNTVLQDSSGGYYIVVDMSPIEEIYNITPSSTESTSYNSAQWAAFQSAIDMQKDKVQTSMQTLTQKYSNANSTFDNLVQVLSSTITSLLECDKGFLNF